MKKQIDCTRGFTLLETVIVTAVMAAVLGAAALLHFNFNTVLGSGTGARTAAYDAARMLGETSSLVRTASAVLTSRSFSGTTYTSGMSTLVLEIPSINSSGVVIANTFDYAVIYQTGSTTTRILSPGSGSSRVGGTKKLASSVASLSFTYDSTDFAAVRSVTTEVRTVLITKGRAYPAHLRAQVYLRNF